ncbi:MAG: hypothetical protein J0G29_02805 [Alphaproteobacteria bacterium]|nr:hypothetical protein [Alphaproteobacteria bacterium]OJV46341.1 MAG: hypothetical protein BGO28_03180 [Alphaproteobacteria bacterium 43-37]
MKKVVILLGVAQILVSAKQAPTETLLVPADFAPFETFSTLSAFGSCALKEALQFKAIGPTVDDMICTTKECLLSYQPVDKLAHFKLISHPQAQAGDLFVSFPAKEFECDMQATILTGDTLSSAAKQILGRYSYVLRAL